MPDVDVEMKMIDKMLIADTANSGANGYQWREI